MQCHLITLYTLTRDHASLNSCKFKSTFQLVKKILVKRLRFMQDLMSWICIESGTSASSNYQSLSLMKVCKLVKFLEILHVSVYLSSNGMYVITTSMTMFYFHLLTQHIVMLRDSEVSQMPSSHCWTVNQCSSSTGSLWITDNFKKITRFWISIRKT